MLRNEMTAPRRSGTRCRSWDTDSGPLLGCLVRHVINGFLEGRATSWRIRFVTDVNGVVEVFCRVVREPDLPGIVLPNKGLRRQVDCQHRRLDHHGRSQLRIAEDNDCARLHIDAVLLAGSRMVYLGENGEARTLALFHGGLEAF